MSGVRQYPVRHPRGNPVVLSSLERSLLDSALGALGALGTLGTLEPSARREETEWIFQVMEGLWAGMDERERERAVLGLLGWLGEGQPVPIRREAMRLLGESGAEGERVAVPRLLQRFAGAEDVATRAAVLRGLGCFPGAAREVVPLLLEHYGRHLYQGREIGDFSPEDEFALFEALGQLLPEAEAEDRYHFQELFLSRSEREYHGFEIHPLLHIEELYEQPRFQYLVYMDALRSSVGLPEAVRYLDGAYVELLCRQALEWRHVSWGEVLGSVARRWDVRLSRTVQLGLLSSPEVEHRLAAIRHAHLFVPTEAKGRAGEGRVAGGAGLG